MKKLLITIIILILGISIVGCQKHPTTSQTDVAKIQIDSYQQNKIEIMNHNSSDVICDVLIGFKKQDALLEQYLAQNITLKAEDKTEISYKTKLNPTEYDNVVILNIAIQLDNTMLANNAPTMQLGQKIIRDDGWEQTGIVGQLDDNGQYYFIQSVGKDVSLFLMNINSSAKDVTIQFQIEYCDAQGNVLQESPVLQAKMRYPYGVARLNIPKGEYPESFDNIRFKYINAIEKSFSYTFDVEFMNIQNLILETRQQSPYVYNILGIDKKVLLQADIYTVAHEYKGTVSVEVTLKPYEGQKLSLPYTEEQKKAIEEGGYIDWK